MNKEYEILYKSAKEGNEEAQYNLGYVVKTDIKKSIYW
jgi:hypothetical protein